MAKKNKIWEMTTIGNAVKQIGICIAPTEKKAIKAWKENGIIPGETTAKERVVKEPEVLMWKSVNI